MLSVGMMLPTWNLFYNYLVSFFFHFSFHQARETVFVLIVIHSDLYI